MLEALSKMAFGASIAGFFLYFANKYFQMKLTTTPKNVFWFALICLALGIILGWNSFEFIRGFQDGFNQQYKP